MMAAFTAPAGRGRGVTVLCAKRKANLKIRCRDKRPRGCKHASWAGVTAGQACFSSHAVTPPDGNTDVSKKKKKAKFTPAFQRGERGGGVHTHSLCHAFTYYVLPFKKNTLASLGPLEEPGWAGLRVTCLSPPPGEQQEEE